MLTFVKDTKFIIVIFFFSLVCANCVQTQNSNTRDELAFATMGIGSIVAANCASCHADFNNLTSAGWISRNLVIPGDPENSPLYYRLNGSLGSKGPKNMPLGSSLTSADVEFVRDWISGL